MAGRPTSLTPELVEKARGYLDTCIDTIRETDKGALAWVDVKLPTKEGLALYLNISRENVYALMKPLESDDDVMKDLRNQYSDIVDQIMSEQAIRLVNKGVGGLYQPKIAGMILSKHGYVEKLESDVTSGGQPIQQEVASVINKFYGSDRKDDKSSSGE